MKPFVVWHADCWDGAVSAFLIFVSKIGDGAEFYRGVYSGDRPTDDQIRGKDVLIVDFSYDADTLQAMMEVANSLLVIDHHKSHMDELTRLTEQDLAIFDLRKSGAHLTWMWLCKNGHIDADNLSKWHTVDGSTLQLATEHTSREKLPWFVAYTEDRDLWRHQLPHTREINAAIRTYTPDLEGVDEMICAGVDTLRCAGESVLRFQQQVIDRHVESDRVGYVTHEGRSIAFTNVSATVLVSDIAGALAAIDGVDIGIGWFELGDGRRVYSVRSRVPPGEEPSSSDPRNAMMYAAKHGGGGHLQAAGFSVATPNHPWDTD